MRSSRELSLTVAVWGPAKSKSWPPKVLSLVVCENACPLEVCHLDTFVKKKNLFVFCTDALAKDLEYFAAAMNF